MRMIVGIDEVGRGPLAGPVCVGVFRASAATIRWLLKNAPVQITDSKKMTAQGRAQVVRFVEAIQAGSCTSNNSRRSCPPGPFSYAVGYASAAYIDRHGIVPAIRHAAARATARAGATATDTYLLDGGLHLPDTYPNQTTIIRGDLTEPAISLAAIIAKQSRDTYMARRARRYPGYGFDQHVGYGTRAHITALQKQGIIPGFHRATFLKRYL